MQPLKKPARGARREADQRSRAHICSGRARERRGWRRSHQRHHRADREVEPADQHRHGLRHGDHGEGEDLVGVLHQDLRWRSPWGATSDRGRRPRRKSSDGEGEPEFCRSLRAKSDMSPVASADSPCAPACDVQRAGDDVRLGDVVALQLAHDPAVVEDRRRGRSSRSARRSRSSRTGSPRPGRRARAAGGRAPAWCRRRCRASGR